ncbi:MAG TPA: MFS transporter [Mycobacterium sp.]|jgi:predicted MFS family arabinose efflux permease
MTAPPRTPLKAVAAAALTAYRWLRRRGEAKLGVAVGGAARLRVIALLALVIGLDSANNGTVGAVTVPLEQAFHVSNTQIGLLVAISSGIGALATLPFGVLTDHVNRTRMLWVAVATWSLAMALSGCAPSYNWLLICRIALAVVVAVAGPAIASLIGDFFAPQERGRIYGFVLAGEMVCAAAGLLVSGLIAALSWRLAFWWLAVLGAVLAVVVAKRLPEPARGGQSRIPIGATRIGVAGERREAVTAPGDAGAGRTDAVADEVLAQRIPPHHELVLTRNPKGRSLWWAVRYVLSIHTNVVLIAASSAGYFFLAGLGTFGVAFLRERFGVGQSLATLMAGVIGLGGLVGVLSFGRIADWLVERGYISARMTVAGIGFLIAVVFFIPALLSHSVGVTIGFAFLAAIGLGGVNPPLDAGRLDIMHSRLWGRAESVRTVLRSTSPRWRRCCSAGSLPNSARSARHF